MRVLLRLFAVLVLLGGCSVTPEKDTGTVTFRLWDEQVARAYEESFAAFTKQNPGITVTVEVVPWADYWTKLATDIGSGTAPDVLWTNTSNFGLYADNGALLPIEDPQRAGWTPSVVDLYTRGGKLWGVPQLWDTIALYYNKDLVAKAGVDPADLTWNPAGTGDTFLPAARALTTGNVYGFNASLDNQGVLWDFVGSNGGAWQDGDAFVFADRPKTVEAVRYLVDLIGEEHVAPPAADTTTNGDKTLQLFTQGRLALFQSGPYHLRAIHEGASFPWGIAPMLAGPAGRVSVVHGVAAAASAATRNRDATGQVLRWLGSAEGVRPIAEGGYAFPGVTAAEPAFTAYWKKQGVDLRPFLDAARGTTFPAPVGPRAGAGTTAAGSVLEQVFLGQLGVEEGLRRAQSAANDAIEE
ncbi:sugar ABC transporter substrate-binding protein [Actinoplanes sp. NBRC 101535]|uniref:ABC transporter substrate-binding protein n=1 Tax=Actinoplanes sp. NBRC 101535 TaxID=3032196 RepID=UPI0024A4834E|nr:sugar ABC transporter substrate-binding protein [Actinoplanes sp. NBRC 101535]GLY00385.1 sugar ABC transporter substrate-binding protein [Actinoplanes sp. NBRC 101535]